MDQYADDLAELIEPSTCITSILVGHSTGGGEVTRYVGRHGTGRVAKVALIGAVPPLMLKTEANPGGLPIDAFDAIRRARSTTAPVLQGPDDALLRLQPRGRASSREGIRDEFWLQGMMGGLKGQLDSIRAFSESDFTRGSQEASTSRRSSCMATTIRSCRSARPRLRPRSSFRRRS